ncbi:hypothetical protein B0T14DRAFT_501921 [Immersiella caudata]|uniref:Uncharacterized protein n=1 Tax=Immersiella caudata TaxID=314043 RepID=A0AA39XD92_9PEZI|nr:hypothetical protein B0T14DRAFT_501921 [Immersiella caudata]
MIVGPWLHMGVSGITSETFAWLETHLGKQSKSSEHRQLTSLIQATTPTLTSSFTSARSASTATRATSQGYLRLGQDRWEDTVQFKLRGCAHVFMKGTCMRVYVAGGCARIYHRNPGSSRDDAVTATESRPSRCTIHHHGSKLSKLVLPVAAKTAV